MGQNEKRGKQQKMDVEGMIMQHAKHQKHSPLMTTRNTFSFFYITFFFKKKVINNNNLIVT